MKQFANVKLEDINTFNEEAAIAAQAQFMQNYKNRLNNSHAGNTHEAKALLQLHKRGVDVQDTCLNIIEHLEKYTRLCSSELNKCKFHLLNEQQLDDLMYLTLQCLPKQQSLAKLREMDTDDLEILLVKQSLKELGLQTNAPESLGTFIQGYKDQSDLLDDWREDVISLFKAARHKNLEQIEQGLDKIRHAGNHVLTENLPYVLSLQIKCYMDLSLYFIKQGYNSETFALQALVELSLQNKVHKLQDLPEAKIDNNKHDSWVSMLFSCGAKRKPQESAAMANNAKPSLSLMKS